MSPSAGGAEQRVDHRVREHVGVGVPVEPALVGDLDAAEDQPAPVGEAVRVVADADPHGAVSEAPIGSRRRLRRSNTASSRTPSSSSSSSALLVAGADVRGPVGVARERDRQPGFEHISRNGRAG